MFLRSDNHAATGKTKAERKAGDVEAVTGQQSMLCYIREECLPALKAARSWEELHRELAKVGLTIKVQNNGVNFVAATGGRVMAHKRRLLMMLDEFPSFGKLQPIADGLAFVAGYGLKIYIISQDTVQFDAIYTDKNSIISNCHIQVMFPPNRLETAKYISQMLGETTVVERQYSVSGKRAGMMHGQVTESMKADKRPLLTTDEVMALPGPKKNSAGDIEEPGEMIIRVSGFAPIRGRQPLYFMDDVFLARAKIPAPLDTDRIGMELTEATVVDVTDAVESDEPANGGVIDASAAPAGGVAPDSSLESVVDADRGTIAESVLDAVAEVSLSTELASESISVPECAVPLESEASHEPQR